MNPLNANPDNIWNYKQNKVHYVLDDCEKLGMDRKAVAMILVARGFNKWIRNRMEFIRLKNEIKHEITETLEQIADAKKLGSYYHIAMLKGYLKAKNEDRKRLRVICHSERWVWPK